MICKSCNSEFANINGLKFCPYCGDKIEDVMDLKAVETINKVKNEEHIISEEHITDKENMATEEDIISDESIVTKIHIKQGNPEDTLPMTAINKEDIKKYKKDKFFVSLKATFKKMKVIIPIIALLVVISAGAFAYTIFSVKPVDEGRIKQDLIGKVVTLPKGTSIKISEDYMKDFTINSRTKDKSNDNDMVKIALSLNNGAIEVKTLLSLVYIYEGKNEWRISDTIVLEGVTELNPVVGMEEKKFLDELKKLSIDFQAAPKVLGEEDVKSLLIASRTPDLQNGKEEILVTASIDSGFLAATGIIKCKLIFQDEVWSIATTERNSTEDFKLVLSPSFSDEKIIEAIKKEGLEETVTYANFFDGKGFKVKDSFTKNITIANKKFDAENGKLNITAIRENVAGQIKTTLSTDYNFSISLSQVSLLNKSKTKVDSGKINNVSVDLVIATIVNSEIEGSNSLFWWSNSDKITKEEASTFKLDEVLSEKGLENIKYVYGSINSIENKKSVNVPFAALYFLVYDEAKGYNWKLNKLVGKDSLYYNEYRRASENQ